MEYASLGLAGLVLVSTIALAFWAKSLSDRGNALADQRDQLRTDEVQKTLDAERAKYDLAAMTAARDAQKARADSLERFVASQAKVTDDAAPLAPDDLAGHVLRVSRAAAAGLPSAGASSGPVAAGPVPGHQGA